MVLWDFGFPVNPPAGYQVISAKGEKHPAVPKAGTNGSMKIHSVITFCCQQNIGPIVVAYLPQLDAAAILKLVYLYQG